MAISNNATGVRPGVCTFATRPTAPYEGQQIYETDTDLSYVWNGSAWQQVSGGTAVGNSGLVFIKQQTIGTLITSVTVSNAFSADYDSYQIVVSGGASNGGNGVAVWTLGSTATGYYFAGNYSTFAGVASVINGSNATAWNLSAYNVNHVGFNIFVNQPFLAKNTSYSTNYYGPSTTDGGGTIQGFLNNTTSYTGFTLTFGSASFQVSGGTITVYGYRKA
jgi:hypothetical protein